MDQQKLNILSIYSPEDCKSKEEREEFYEQLQIVLDEIPQEPLILMGDFNAGIGNEIVQK